MTRQEKFDAISKAYTVKKVEDDRESIYIISDDCPKEVRRKLLDMQGEIVDHSFDLSYEIFASACDVIANAGLEALSKEDFDTIEAVGEQASVYTATRLSYLNMWNEAEISENVSMYGSIATACAVWYDHKVELAVDEVREYILKDEVRCNNCMTVMHQDNLIIIDDMKACPSCKTDKYLMDLQ